MHYIEGKWVEAGHETFASYNPATNELLWEGTTAGAKEVKEAIRAAKEAFALWSEMPLERRIEYLKRFQELVKENSDELATTVSKEVGKPFWEAKQEVAALGGKVDASIAAYEERCAPRTNKSLTTRYKPIGIVGVIGPFNFPLHIPSGHIIPALLAGNCVLFKGSDQTPLSSQKLVALWEKSGLPVGVLQMVQGKKETGQLLIEAKEVKGLFFTGSAAVGAKLHAECPYHKILALELGGNNPLVVEEAEDFEAASYLTLLSSYLTAGQRCSSARRLIVVESKRNREFIKTLASMTAQLRIGPYTNSPEPFLGPLISNASKERLLSLQASLGTAGGEVLVEMRSLSDTAPFISCGLMDVTKVHHLEDEEYFGPFLQLIWVKDFAKAIEVANQTAYGLSATLISNKEELFDPFLAKIEAGVININSPTTGASGLAPFGGIKKSGNFRPSGYFAADYCSYPIASMRLECVKIPEKVAPGVEFLATT